MLDENGHEILDDTPVAIPTKFSRPPTLAEQVRQLVKGAMSAQAAEQGYETFEEADDFMVGDDYDPTSPYEMDFDQEFYHEPTNNEGSPTGAPQPDQQGAPQTTGDIQQGGKSDPGSATGAPPNK